MEMQKRDAGSLRSYLAEGEDISADEEILAALDAELARMLARNYGEERSDIKYVVLKEVVGRLKDGEAFADIFLALSPEHQHAVVTRLENSAYWYRVEGAESMPPMTYEFVEGFRFWLYGTLDRPNGRGKDIDRTEQFQLEKSLQSQNK